MLRAELAGQHARLNGIGEFSNDKLREIRGRVQALQWALGLPEEIRERIRKATLALAQAAEDEEGEPDA